MDAFGYGLRLITVGFLFGVIAITALIARIDDSSDSPPGNEGCFYQLLIGMLLTLAVAFVVAAGA